MIGYVELIRPLNGVMTALAVFVGALIAGGLGFFTNEGLYLAMLAAFLIAGAGNTINDVVDVGTDRINRPKRTIPSGRISKRTALAFSVLLFLIGIVLAGMINFIIFIIAIANSFVLIVYSTHLQNKLFLGNAAISYLVASAFLFGGATLGSVTQLLPILILMLLAGTANLSREIAKDMEDIEGDKRTFMKRLSAKVKKTVAERFGITKKGVGLRYGRRRFKEIAGGSLIISIITSPLPYLYGMFGISYLVFLIPTDIVFVLALYRLAKGSTKKQFARISKIIKLGMFLGLLAFIAGALV